MKFSLSLALVLLTCLVGYADDLADAKKAFQTLLEYQKTDDVRSLDLFATNCTARFILTDGNQSVTNALSGEVFRTELSRQIAKKEGNRDQYDNVEYKVTGNSVVVESDVRFAAPVNRGHLILEYRRDPEGVLRIVEMQITTYIKPARP